MPCWRANIVLEALTGSLKQLTKNGYVFIKIGFLRNDRLLTLLSKDVGHWLHNVIPVQTGIQYSPRESGDPVWINSCFRRNDGRELAVKCC